MQEYLHRTRFSGLMDEIGFHLLTLSGSLMWFALLWGLRLSTITAGIALYCLILLLRAQTRDSRITRKEKTLRMRIGGELALERLLLTPREQANFEAAMLLSMHAPLTLLRTGADGTLCEMRGEKLLVAFEPLPEGETLSPARVLALQRSVRQKGASRGVLCTPCDISQKAREMAKENVPVRLIPREALIQLFGQANPATDAQLVVLGQRKKNRPAESWFHIVLDRRRARRYACYGVLLLLMYQFTQLMYYAVPGLVCVCLAAASRCVRSDDSLL